MIVSYKVLPPNAIPEHEWIEPVLHLRNRVYIAFGCKLSHWQVGARLPQPRGSFGSENSRKLHEQGQAAPGRTRAVKQKLSWQFKAWPVRIYSYGERGWKWNGRVSCATTLDQTNGRKSGFRLRIFVRITLIITCIRTLRHRYGIRKRGKNYIKTAHKREVYSEYLLDISVIQKWLQLAFAS